MLQLCALKYIPRLCRCLLISLKGLNDTIVSRTMLLNGLSTDLQPICVCSLPAAARDNATGWTQLLVSKSISSPAARYGITALNNTDKGESRDCSMPIVIVQRWPNASCFPCFDCIH